MSESRPKKYYWEDFAVGTVREFGGMTLEKGDIVRFARDWDPQPFHVDEEAAKRSPYGGLIASGWHTISATMRQLVEFYVSAESSLGAAGVDEIRWPRPVRPGDTLHVRARVSEARRSASKPDRGIVRGSVEVTNAGGEVVMTFSAINFVLLRDPSA